MLYNITSSFGVCVFIPGAFLSVAPWRPEREVEMGSPVRFGDTGSSLLNLIYPFRVLFSVFAI